MNKLLELLSFCVLATTVSEAQQFQLKWETPAVPYPSGSISYIGNIEKSPGGKFLIEDTTNVLIYDGLSHTLKYSFQKYKYEYPELGNRDNYLMTPNQDYNGDGITDFFLGSSSPPNAQYTLHLVNPSDGTIIAKFDSGAAQFSPLGVADVDGDGKLELLIEKTVDKISGSDYQVQSIQVFSTNLTVTSTSNSTQRTPVHFQLNQNYPNPFNPSTRISYTLHEQTIVHIQIFDIAGQLVRSLLNDRQDAGNHFVDWDGKSNSGDQVSSGPYFYEIKAAGLSQAKKMILIK